MPFTPYYISPTGKSNTGYKAILRPETAFEKIHKLSRFFIVPPVFQVPSRLRAATVVVVTLALSRHFIQS